MKAAAKLPPETEAGFQRCVLAYARMCGWRCAHFRASLNQRGQWQTAAAGDGAGFPDWIFLRGDRMLVVELKTDTGKLAPEQRAWLDAFTAAGVTAVIWRPRDFAMIEKELE